MDSSQVVPSLLIIFQGCANKMLSEDEFWYATPLVLLIGEQLVSTPFNLPFSLSKQSYMEKNTQVSAAEISHESAVHLSRPKELVKKWGTRVPLGRPQGIGCLSV